MHYVYNVLVTDFFTRNVPGTGTAREKKNRLSDYVVVTKDDFFSRELCLFLACYVVTVRYESFARVSTVTRRNCTRGRRLKYYSYMEKFESWML